MGEEMRFTDTTTELTDSNAETVVGDKGWYVVNCYSTHEKKVADNLLKRVETMGLQNLVFRVLVPEEEVPVMKDGQVTDKTRMKIIYPGYVFVEVIMTDFVWYVIRNTPNVTGFVGSSGKGTKPFPIPREQIEPVLKIMGLVDESMYDRYKEGDQVKVIHGPLESTEGKILSIDKENGTVEIETIFFGRKTNVTVDFSDIGKN